MYAVMARPLPGLAEMRRESGADRWDEVWDGVLHMTPGPNRDHSVFQGDLYRYLRDHWAEKGVRRVFLDLNISPPGTEPWTKNYRQPDLILLTADRFGIDKNEYFEGGPTVVVELRSPGDESYAKLPFYASLGIPEVWIIDRDSRAPSLFVLSGSDYQLQGTDDGWLVSAATGLRMRGGAGTLELQRGTDESTRDQLIAGDY